MDYSKLEEIKAGEKQETKITEVNEGKQSDFRGEKYFENIDGTDKEIQKIKDSAALQVKCDNHAELVINLPANNRLSPKSKLAMFKKIRNNN